MSVLEALRQYAKDQIKNRNGPVVLCERHYVEHLDELIKANTRQRATPAAWMTGVVPPTPNEDDKS